MEVAGLCSIARSKVFNDQERHLRRGVALSEGGAENYTIQTQQQVLDVVIGWVTGMVTIYPRTVTVTK